MKQKKKQVKIKEGEKKNILFYYLSSLQKYSSEKKT